MPVTFREKILELSSLNQCDTLKNHFCSITQGTGGDVNIYVNGTYKTKYIGPEEIEVKYLELPTPKIKYIENEKIKVTYIGVESNKVKYIQQPLMKIKYICQQ